MLPTKVKEFVKKLTEATTNGDIAWSSDADEAEVNGTFKSNKVRIRYRFDEVEEIGVYYLSLIDKNGKPGAFEASQSYQSDYELLRVLYDMAQACDLDLDE